MKASKRSKDYWVHHYSRKIRAWLDGRLLAPDSHVRWLCHVLIVWSKA